MTEKALKINEKLKSKGKSARRSFARRVRRHCQFGRPSAPQIEQIISQRHGIQPVLFLAVFLLVAIGFALLPLGPGSILGEKIFARQTRSQKNAIYECGLEAKETKRRSSSNREYYLYAIIFLVFDVEVLFLLPFAGCVFRAAAGCVHRDADFCVPGRGRVGLGMDERLFWIGK